MHRLAPTLMFFLAFSFTLAQGTVGLSLSTLNNPFFVTLRDGAQAVADEAGLELIVVDAQDSVSTQISGIGGSSPKATKRYISALRLRNVLSEIAVDTRLG